MNSTRGFTLIEIVVALAVSMIMLLAIGTAIETMQKSSTGIERKVTAQEDVRAALELMAMEIRMASYNPSLAWNVDIWRNTNCAAPPATNPNYRGIQGATANSITVEMDIAGSGGSSGNPPDGDGTLTQSNEIISYNYVSAGSERYITRNTNCGGAQPFLGDLSTSGNPRTVRVINQDLGIPMFRYFDSQGVELLFSAGTGRVCMPGCTPDIRTIEITLAVQTDEIDPNTKQRRNMIYTTREAIKNHIIVRRQ
jgi:prepilin-type N-terminal cleavage/methylation domain-containing protein